MTESEVARDLSAVLNKVRDGAEIVVERGSQPVAVIRPPVRSGRPISEILRNAKARNSTVTLDSDFGKDLEEIIASRHPWNPPSWE